MLPCTSTNNLYDITRSMTRPVNPERVHVDHSQINYPMKLSFVNSFVAGDSLPGRCLPDYFL